MLQGVREFRHTTPRFNTARFLEMGVSAPTRARGLRVVGKVG